MNDSVLTPKEIILVKKALPKFFGKNIIYLSSLNFFLPKYLIFLYHYILASLCSRHTWYYPSLTSILQTFNPKAFCEFSWDQILRQNMPLPRILLFLLQLYDNYQCFAGKHTKLFWLINQKPDEILTTDWILTKP